MSVMQTSQETAPLGTAAVDVEGLFRKFTVEEIYEIEKKIRSDVETKKEDLRQTVGRRYRDIIETADNIREMRQTSEKILNDIRCVQVCFDDLQQAEQRLVSAQKRTQMLKNTDLITDDKRTRIAERLYAELPELVFDAMAQENYLVAAYLHCLASKLYVQYCSSGRSEIVQSKYLLDHSAATLYQKCQDVCKDPSASVEVLQDSIAGICLLKQCSYQQAFDDFWSTRLTAIETTFDRVDLSCTKQVTLVIELITNTIVACSHLFAGDSPRLSALLEGRFKDISTPAVLSENFAAFQKRACSWLHYDVLLSMLKHTFQGNLQEKNPKFNVGMPDQCFSYLQKLKELCTVRLRGVLNYFDHISSLTSLKRTTNQAWTQTCKSVLFEPTCFRLLGASYDVFGELVEPLIDARLFVLLEEEVKGLFGMLTRDLHNMKTLSFVDASALLWDTVTKDNNTHASSLEPRRYLSADIQMSLEAVDRGLLQLQGSCQQYMNLEDPTTSDPTAQHVQAWIGKFCCAATRNTFQSLKELHTKDPVATKSVAIGLVCAQLITSPPLLECASHVDDWNAVLLLSKGLHEEAFRSYITAAVAEAHSLLMIDASEISSVTNIVSVTLGSHAGDSNASSTFSIPGHCSIRLQNFLHELCSKLNCVGLLNIPPSLFPELILCTTKAVTEAYQKLLEKHRADITQRQALQTVFDLQFINLALSNKAHSASVPSDLVSSFESVADPFDLSVLYGKNKQQIHQCVARSTAFIAPLVSNSTVPAGSTAKSLAGTGDNQSQQLLVLHSQIPQRIQLLPIPSLSQSQLKSKQPKSVSKAKAPLKPMNTTSEKSGGGFSLDSWMKPFF